MHAGTIQFFQICTLLQMCTHQHLTCLFPGCSQGKHTFCYPLHVGLQVFDGQMENFEYQVTLFDATEE